MAEQDTDKNNSENPAVSEDATPSNDDILKQLGSDYADYMKLDITKEVSQWSLVERKTTQVGRPKYVTQNLLK